MPFLPSPNLRLGIVILGLALLPPRAFPQQAAGGQEPEKLTDPRAMEFYGNAKTVVNLPLEEAIHRLPHTHGLEPAAGQDDLARILADTGRTVQAFFQDFPNTACDEKVFEESQFEGRHFQPGRTQKFRYLALNRTGKGLIGLEEFRTDAQGNFVKPKGFFTTMGFVSTSEIFQPEFQGEAVFRLLGRQKVKGRETFVVGFAQLPGKARIVGKATFGGDEYILTLVQGAAWIDAQSYQIVRLVTQLLAPRPDIGLKVQSTDISYEQVRFKTGAVTAWLPEEVAVTEQVTEQGMDMTYRSTHTYSNFRVFRVEAGEKRPEAK